MIRKRTAEGKDPVCRSLLSLTEEQQETAEKVAGWVELLPPGLVGEMFSRIINYDGESGRKMTPMDVWAFMHPGFKQVTIVMCSLGDNSLYFSKLSISRRESSYRPLPNTHKAVLDCLYRLDYLEHLNLSGLDHHSVPSQYNDITYSEDLLEHYLYIISDCLRNLGRLVTLNLGSLVTNNILREVSQSCTGLRELRARGPCGVTDLGVRYLTGINRTAGHISRREETGCKLLKIVDLSDISLSLHTLTLLLIHLPQLAILSREREGGSRY